MNNVRIYLNLNDGATWWAEDDVGSVGGADRLSDLIEKMALRGSVGWVR